MKTMEVLQNELKNQQMKQLDIEAKIFQTREQMKQAEEAHISLTEELAFVRGVIQSLDFTMSTLQAEGVKKE